MQISISSSQEQTAREQMDPACLIRCPACSGTLILLHNFYRCSRCSYHLCAGCEAMEPSEPEA